MMKVMKSLFTLLFCCLCICSMALPVKLHLKTKDGEERKVTVSQLGGFNKILLQATINGQETEHEVEVAESGFYSIIVSGIYNGMFFLVPGNTVEMTVASGKMDWQGDFASVNRAIERLEREVYGLEKKFRPEDPFNEERCLYYQSVYRQAQKLLGKMKLKASERKLINGYIQGVLLHSVYGKVVDSKIFGKGSKVVIADGYAHSLRDFQPDFQITNYPYWYEDCRELAYTRLYTGKVKISGLNTWINDLASSFTDRDFRAAFVYATLDKETLMGYYVGLDQRFEKARALVAGTPYQQLLVEKQREYEQKRTDKVGQYVGDIEFLDIEGNPVQLSRYKGKYVVIDCWSTGCNPCIGEMPYMRKIEHAFRENPDIVFVSISFDTRKKIWTDYLTAHQMKGEQLLNPTGPKNPIVEKCGLRGIPHFLVLDKESKILIPNAYRPSNPILGEELKFILMQNK